MRYLFKLLRSYLPLMVLLLSISSGSSAQENADLEKERATLENLYTLILSMEFCSELNLFFDPDVVEEAKQKSKEKVRDFVTSDSEKNQIWIATEKDANEAFFVIKLADFAKQYEICSHFHTIYQTIFIDTSLDSQKSSEKPF